MITAMELSPTWAELLEVGAGIRHARTYAPPAAAPARPPAPHARRKPDLTISMLEVLKTGTEREDGRLAGDRGVLKGLVIRGLANWYYDGQGNDNTAYVTENGYTLIATQYAALKKVLPETRSQYR